MRARRGRRGGGCGLAGDDVFTRVELPYRDVNETDVIPRAFAQLKPKIFLLQSGAHALALIKIGCSDVRIGCRITYHHRSRTEGSAGAGAGRGRGGATCGDAAVCSGRVRQPVWRRVPARAPLAPQLARPRTTMFSTLINNLLARGSFREIAVIDVTTS
ncbi:hypothetical protein EVAR_29606_1 [Eumeta japonica]|uniref:Uncharacterized protein n=1 Tax=Eumeta variegata TaxID=151549 RepID=A0A4C1VVX0_EUMVA|nr:hypothetical protein EVAR_29606_1 [Eumeta japonica]